MIVDSSLFLDHLVITYGIHFFVTVPFSLSAAVAAFALQMDDDDDYYYYTVDYLGHSDI